MSVLVSCQGISRHHGVEPVFEGLDCELRQGERLAVIGPNGSGKSTLLRILVGDDQPDSGRRSQRADVRIGYVRQEEQFADGVTVLEVLRSAAAPLEAEHLIAAAAERGMNRAGFTDPDHLVDRLSGGWRKRLAIVAALAAEPDLLLLDEPTNHLDLEGLLWLQDLILNFRGTSCFVSHDRWFLRTCSSRVLEINPRFSGGCFAASGDYEAFLTHRSEHISGMLQREQSLANKLRREEVWLSRRPKARTTKSNARIKGAADLADELDSVKKLNRSERAADIRFGASGRQTTDLLLCEGVTVSRGDKQLICGLDLQLAPGECLGLLGTNGSGKSSLLAALLGDLAPSAGRLKRAHELRVATFDQTRAKLDRNQTIGRALSPSGDTVTLPGGGKQHVNAYAQRFLFDSHQLDQVVDSCSGGEQARLLIAQLMREEADVLVLDEPTNDLDIPALEVLETALRDFAGGVVLVSHDRYLMDQVCDRFIALDGNGAWRNVGDYAQWERQRAEAYAAATGPAPAAPSPSPAEPTAQLEPSGPELSYAEQKELRNIEGRIEKAEQALEAAHAALADRVVYTNPDRLLAAEAEAETAQVAVDQLYARWEQLGG
ncbi:MAG: ABC-F family ATP-binding cassette domain-containing protein [Planctomycetota bacterium]|jgi:ATP-binding cassette subfamily F protein uup|nr:ABC-F family ATP-binding cassette domain-containing protein [Planctomycetota bacterium]